MSLTLTPLLPPNRLLLLLFLFLISSNREEGRKKHVLKKSHPRIKRVCRPALKPRSKSKLYVHDMSECQAYGCACLLGSAKAHCTSAISLLFSRLGVGKKIKKIKPSCFSLHFGLSKEAYEKAFSFFHPGSKTARQPAQRMRGFQESFCKG